MKGFRENEYISVGIHSPLLQFFKADHGSFIFKPPHSEIAAFMDNPGFTAKLIDQACLPVDLLDPANRGIGIWKTDEEQLWDHDGLGERWEGMGWLSRALLLGGEMPNSAASSEASGACQW